MAEITITYSNRLQGWTSFFSFRPEWMIGMNNVFYTMKAGNLYRHRDPTVNRNNFYGQNYDSSITNVFNDAPMEAKMFKTIGLESNAPWRAVITTDLEAGQIQTDWYLLKEGDWYANIRRNDNNTDLDLMSAQGIGTCAAVAGVVPGTITITFGININKMVNIGDTIYKTDTSAGNEIGVATAVSNNVVEVAVSLNAPNIGDYIFAIKDSVAESYGARGYYMEVQLINSLTTPVEMFAMKSDAFKSYP